MGYPLTELTEKQLCQLFAPSDQEAARTILINEVGGNLLRPNRNSENLGIERIRSAVLKISKGKISRLQNAARRANDDWRDVLYWAGLANDPTAHERWVPGSKIFEPPPFIDLWFSLLKKAFGRGKNKS